MDDEAEVSAAFSGILRSVASSLYCSQTESTPHTGIPKEREQDANRWAVYRKQGLNL